MHGLLAGVQTIFLEVHRHWSLCGGRTNGGGITPFWGAIFIESQFSGQEEQVILGRRLALFSSSFRLAIEAVHIANDFVSLYLVFLRGVLLEILLLIEFVQVHGHHKVGGQLLSFLFGTRLRYLHLFGSEVELRFLLLLGGALNCLAQPGRHIVTARHISCEFHRPN